MLETDPVETELRQKLHQTLSELDELVSDLPSGEERDGLMREMSKLREVLVQWRKNSSSSKKEIE